MIVANVSLDLPALHAYTSAAISLLGRVAQSRQGGKAVLNAGFFMAMHESGIFAADPDIGFDVQDVQALDRFYSLCLANLRVINAIVLSQDNENDQTIYQARKFLGEYRSSILSIFKKNAGIGSVGVNSSTLFKELVDNYTALLVSTDFIEVCPLDSKL